MTAGHTVNLICGAAETATQYAMAAFRGSNHIHQLLKVQIIFTRKRRCDGVNMLMQVQF
jgi:hypothetical protein